MNVHPTKVEVRFRDRQRGLQPALLDAPADIPEQRPAYPAAGHPGTAAAESTQHRRLQRACAQPDDRSGRSSPGRLELGRSSWPAAPTGRRSPPGSSRAARPRYRSRSGSRFRRPGRSHCRSGVARPGDTFDEFAAAAVRGGLPDRARPPAGRRRRRVRLVQQTAEASPAARARRTAVETSRHGRARSRAAAGRRLPTARLARAGRARARRFRSMTAT